MTKFSASIEYNPTTLRKLNTVINSTFRTGLKRIYLAICIGLVCAGAALGLQTPQGMALVCIGCFLLPSVRTVENNRGEQMIKRMNGKTLTVEYDFEEKQFFCAASGERNAFSYDSIARLVEDAGYFYLFPNAQQAYMVDRSTLKPDDEESFRTFITQQVGLEWTKPTTFLSMNLRTLRFNRRNTRLKR